MKIYKSPTAYQIVNIFVSVYLSFFLLRSLYLNNQEFTGYICFFFLGFIFANLFFEKYLKKYVTMYIFISLFLLLHILGGVVYFDETRMYDYYFFNIIRYDWFMHILGGFLSGRIAYEIVKDNFLYTKDSYQLLIVIIIILSVGVGTFNEIVEFMAVIFLNAEKAVGDYYNNLTDICNNLIGSIVYLLIFSKTHKFREYDFASMKLKND